MGRFHYSRAELADAFKAAGVKDGDIIFCIVGLLKLGIPKETHEGSSAFDVVYGAIRDAIGESGTLLTPTYTYSFCKGEVFDPRHTPSTIGPFGNELLKLDGSERSLDPIFSVAGIGPAAKELFADLPNTCFGEGCLYDRLGKTEAKICAIGVGLHYATAIHHLEEMAGVPHRFRKLFSGQIKKGENLVKENWIYSVRVLGDFSNPSFSKAETEAIDLGLCRYAEVGLGRLTVIPFKDLYKLCRARLEQDPWCFAQGPPVDLLESERKRVGEQLFPVDFPEKADMEQMGRALWQLPRDLVSDGFDAALQALATQIPMAIHEYPTGSECFTWIVPEKWTCHEAYLETLNGERLFSYADNPLGVVSYSLPFEGVVSREELFKHLHAHPKLPGAIPYVTNHYERDWGLCCTRELKEGLKDDCYRVVIRNDFSYGSLKVGEAVAPGDTDDCIVLCAHLCHPGQFNNGLSAVVLAIEVMRNLLERSDLHYTYRLLIVPESIGSAAYLSGHQHLIPKMKGGLFLSMLGTGHPHALQLSLNKGSQIDRCLELIVKDHDKEARAYDFLDTMRDDEMMFNAPGVSVPMLSLSRVLPPDNPDEPYPEYRSSLDNIDSADFDGLNDSKRLVLKIIDAIEGNRIPVPLFKGELFLPRIKCIDRVESRDEFLRLLFSLDGRRTVADLALEVGLTFETTKGFLDILHREGLIGWKRNGG